MEEPENGIHPERMEAMVSLLRDLAVDPFETPGMDNPMRQVIVNTHSPAMVQLQRPDDLLLARTVQVRGPTGGRQGRSGSSRCTRPGVPVRTTQGLARPASSTISQSPRGAQLQA